MSVAIFIKAPCTPFWMIGGGTQCKLCASWLILLQCSTETEDAKSERNAATPIARQLGAFNGCDVRVKDCNLHGRLPIKQQLSTLIYLPLPVHRQPAIHHALRPILWVLYRNNHWEAELDSLRVTITLSTCKSLAPSASRLHDLCLDGWDFNVIAAAS